MKKNLRGCIAQRKPHVYVWRPPNQKHHAKYTLKTNMEATILGYGHRFRGMVSAIFTVLLQKLTSLT